VRRSVSLSGSGCMGLMDKRLEDIADAGGLATAVEVVALAVLV
jgi:hypothetical protein